MIATPPVAAKPAAMAYLDLPWSPVVGRHLIDATEAAYAPSGPTPPHSGTIEEALVALVGVATAAAAIDPATITGRCAILAIGPAVVAIDGGYRIPVAGGAKVVVVPAGQTATVTWAVASPSPRDRPRTVAARTAIRASLSASSGTVVVTPEAPPVAPIVTRYGGLPLILPAGVSPVGDPDAIRANLAVLADLATRARWAAWRVARSIAVAYSPRYSRTLGGRIEAERIATDRIVAHVVDLAGLGDWPVWANCYKKHWAAMCRDLIRAADAAKRCVAREMAA